MSAGIPKDKPRPGKHHVEITRVTLDARVQGLRPDEQLCIGAVAPFRGQRARNIGHVMSTGLEFSETRDPIAWSNGAPTDGHGQSIECFIQVFPSDRLRAPVVNDRACRRAQEENGVGNPGERLRIKQRAVDDVLARLCERDEMTGEVSTVDRGYVFGIERAEVTRVVPVIEMTTETLESVHRSQRGFEPLDCGNGAEPAEIVRSDGGEEI